MMAHRRWGLAAALASLIAGSCGGKKAATTLPDGSAGTGADVSVDQANAGEDAVPTADWMAPTLDGAPPASDGPRPDAEVSLPAPDTGGLQPDLSIGGLPRRITWQKEPGGPDFARGMGGTSAADVWIGGTGGNVWHSTGNGQWSRRDIDTPGDVNGFWGTGPNNVYATAFINRVSRWNGSGWDRFDFQGGVTFRAVWGSGPSDVYAVGGAVFRSAGDGMWRLEPDNVSDPLVGVWGSGPSDVWVLLGGSAGVMHSKGDGKWVTQKGGTSLTPGVAVWGTSASDVYALWAGELLHSTGNGTWIPQAIDRAPSERLNCICGSGPNDIYVGTSTGRVFRSTGDGRWHAERFLPMDTRVLDVAHCWAAPNGEVFTVTDDGTYHGRPAP